MPGLANLEKAVEDGHAVDWSATGGAYTCSLSSTVYRSAAKSVVEARVLATHVYAVPYPPLVAVPRDLTPTGGPK